MTGLKAVKLKHSDFSHGFTLIEMLVSVLILSLVLIAVYSFFDQGQWLYTSIENQTANQQNVRIVMENLERDVRMAASGVPVGSDTSGTLNWSPFIFTAERSKIYFHADVDSRTTLVTTDAASGAGAVTVEDPSVVCPSANTPLAIYDSDKRKWQAVLCASVSGSSINVSPNTAIAFPATSSTVYSPDTIFYRLTGDADGDGVCDDVNGDSVLCTDNTNRKAGGDYPFCNIERAVVYGNDPGSAVAPWSADRDANSASFETVATNICTFQLHYYSANGTEINSGNVPLTGGFLQSIQRVKATITSMSRTNEGPGKYQELQLNSDILLRSAKY
jgi:prepilin-type N-terminal cleavage/methylation domain-containing protein